MKQYLYRDDGMYHLKVINLKISRERRGEEKKKRIEKTFANRFHLNSNKSRALRSSEWKKKRKKRVKWKESEKLERVDSSDSCPQNLNFMSFAAC